jgi:alpha-1,2-mannosyltransferase
VYAIRSWAYAGIHAVVILVGNVFPFVGSKSAEFYFLRIVFALVCALCETRLYSVAARALSPRIAIIFLIAMVTSTGMFHASTAYLPSSFAMYTTMLGTAAFMDWRGGLHTAQGIMWFGIGALLGWPFAGALVLPYALEEVFVAIIADDMVVTVRRLLDATVRCIIVLVSPARSHNGNSNLL